MTAKRGPLYAQNASVTSTSDKKLKEGVESKKINFILASLMACRQNLSPITGQEKK
jgi:hypothetical protein